MARLELSGVGIASGVGIGTALVLHTPDAGPIGLRQLEASESPHAWDMLEAARAAAIARLGEIQSATARELGLQDAAIYGAQAAVLSDPDAVRDLKQAVLEEHLAPESAIQALLDKFSTLFENLEGGDMKSWAADLRDPWQMVLRELEQKEEQRADDCGPVVLIAEELTPTLLTRLPRENIAAVVCSRGGRFSHGAVLARSFGLPTISAIDGVHRKARSGDRCVVYGRDGRILVGSEPDEEAAARTLADQRAPNAGQNCPGRGRGGTNSRWTPGTDSREY